MRGARVILAALAAAALLAGCGSDSSSSATPGGKAAAVQAAKTAAARAVTVTVRPTRLDADKQQVPALEQVTVHLTSTMTKPSAVTLIANGQTIGQAPHVRQGDTFTVIVPQLQPGKLVIKAGSRKAVLKVRAAH